MAVIPSNITLARNVLFEPLDLIRFWDYTTTDAVSDVEETDPLNFDQGVYFSTEDCRRVLRTKDILRVTASDGKGLYLLEVQSAPLGNPTVTLRKIASVNAFIDL